MKAIRFEKFGGPEVLEYKDIEIGKPGPKEVLVKNLSVGLNYIDVYQRTGLYQIELPSGLGLEASGVVEEIGPSEFSNFPAITFINLSSSLCVLILSESI